jgi:hypothetical protein
MEAAGPARQAGREYDDVALARKVESEILRPADAPRGAISVNACDGVVELRGQVKRPEDVTEFGEAATKVTGVKRVHNLLDTPGSPPKPSPVSTPDEVRERAEALHRLAVLAQPRHDAIDRRAHHPSGSRTQPGNVMSHQHGSILVKGEPTSALSRDENG